MNGIKGTLYTICGAATGLLLFTYSFCCIETGSMSIDPLKQRELLLEKGKKYEEIFSPYGLADTDKNGEVSIGEKASVLEQMGIKCHLSYDSPTLNDLTSFIEEAESENPHQNP